LQVRDPRAGYLQTLSVLRAAKECGVYTKSSIMLGLGETGEGGRCWCGVVWCVIQWTTARAVFAPTGVHPCV